MGKPGRKTLRLEGTALSAEGRLFDYLNHNPVIGARESSLRALRAFYLPWAMADHSSEEALKVLARTAIQELQFRIFQIQQQFLMEEAIAPFPTTTPASVVMPSSIAAEPMRAGAIATTIEQMRQEANWVELSQVLDDF